MRWRGGRQSTNVEDARGMSGPAVAGGGAGLLIIAIIIALLGGDPRQFLQQVNNQQAAAPAAAGPGANPELSPEEIEAGEFCATVLGYSEDVWSRLFKEAGKEYRYPTMRLFSGQTQSACGGATSASGPFYCPADEKLYLDTSFFAQLARDLNAPGDFAQAYVIAHEVGHHVQNLLGYTDQLDAFRPRLSEVENNEYSVKLELQADFFAGVMLHHADRMQQVIEPGDVQEALRAATAIGDDTLQRRAGAAPRKETFTHGTSEQRERWFRKGLETGDLSQGDTFSAKTL
jgi:uncharacterized protein